MFREIHTIDEMRVLELYLYTYAYTYRYIHQMYEPTVVMFHLNI